MQFVLLIHCIQCLVIDLKCVFVFWRAVIRSSSRPQGPRGGSLWWRLWGDTAVIWQPPQASLSVRTPLIFLKNHSTFMTSRWVTLLTLLTSAHSRRINAVFLEIKNGSLLLWHFFRPMWSIWQRKWRRTFREVWCWGKSVHLLVCNTFLDS